MTSRPLRLAELLASVSLATDLGTGQPPGHALRTCAIATALAEAMGCGPDDVRTVHQFALLRILGCTADAAETAAMVGGDDLAVNAAMAPVIMGSGREMMGRYVRSVGADQPPMRRIRLVTRALADLMGGGDSLATHCEVASMLAGRAGLGEPVVDALAHAYERWDGKGWPAGLAGDAIRLAVRVAVVARDVDLATTVGDDPRRWLRERRERAAPDRARAVEPRGRRPTSSPRRRSDATSRTCTGRSASRREPLPRSSRWSTDCSTEMGCSPDARRERERAYSPRA